MRRADSRSQDAEGRVFYLPHVTDRTGPSRPDLKPIDGEVIEGELVERSTQPGTAIEPYGRPTFGTRRIVPIEARQRIAHGAIELTHRAAPIVKTGTTSAGRELYYVAKGAATVAKRVWEAKTNSAYERDLRQARSEGDREFYLEVEARAEQARERRHRRRMELLKEGPKALAAALAIGTASIIGFLLMLGIVLALATDDSSRILDPITGVIDAITWTYWFLATYGALMLIGATVVAVGALRHIGKRAGEVPRWVARQQTHPEQRDVVPDENAILTALRNLGLAPLNRALSDGWQPRWVSPTTRKGNGWHTQLLLPQGVTVEMIAAKKATLAHNLLRKPIEVWPTEPKTQPGVLDLWVADQGILTGPVPPWPLLHDGSADFFKGVPVAVDARGEVVIGKLMARNYLVAGIMGSGKSSLVRNLVLGAMLDPLVDIDVHVMAFNVDYDAMRDRLRTLVKGDEDEHIEAAMETLRGLVTEVSRRGQALEALGGEEAKLTREIAARDASMRPRIVVFDEVHELFTHKRYGPEAKELALKVTKKARKTGIVLIWATPEADAASLPRGIAKTVSNRVAFAINDHQGNDAILGTGMHKAGYSATTLVAGEDVGVAMAAGFAKTPGLIRCYYVRKEKGIDEITPVVKRALALREKAGISQPDTLPEPERLDPLADVAAVVEEAGVRRMRTLEVLQRLAERNPAAYRDWTFTDLTRLLAGTPAEVYKSGGERVVSAARLREAITERDHGDDGDGDETG